MEKYLVDGFNSVHLFNSFFPYTLHSSIAYSSRVYTILIYNAELNDTAQTYNAELNDTTGTFFCKISFIGPFLELQHSCVFTLVLTRRLVFMYVG